MNNVESRDVLVLDSIELDEYIIVDVRTPMEFFHGHIKGAKNVPFEKLDDWLKLMVDWGRPVILCTAWDNRSRRACEKLKSRGVKAIDGGYWETLQEKIKGKFG